MLTEGAVVTLGPELEILSGFAFPSSGFHEAEGLPLVRIRDLGKTSTEIRFRGRFDERFLVADGDMLIGMDGDFLAVRWGGGPSLLNQRVCRVVARSGGMLDQGYLFHLLQPKLDEIHRKTPQTTVRHLSTIVIQRIRHALPPLPEQRRIAEILDTIDEAIRKTEQVIAKLQQMKQGLLHDLLTRGIDENGELRDPERHPEQFKDSALGRIPKVWDVGRLARWIVGSPKNGYSPQAADEWTGTMMLGLGCLTSNGFAARQLKNAPGGDPQLVKALLNPGDLLLSRSNTRELVGLSGVYTDIGAPCIYPDLMMRLTPSEATTGRFLDSVLRSTPLRRQMQATASGTSGSMVKISSTIVRMLIVTMPDRTEQDSILFVADRADAMLQSENAELKKLRTVKHGLTDDLLTGRVRVDVEGSEAA